MSKGFAKSFTWGGFFSCRSSSLLPEVKMIQKFFKIFTGLETWTSNYVKFIARKNHVRFLRTSCSSWYRNTQGLSFSGTSMDIHIPHKNTRTSHNKIVTKQIFSRGQFLKVIRVPPCGAPDRPQVTKFRGKHCKPAEPICWSLNLPAFNSSLKASCLGLRCVFWAYHTLSCPRGPA